MQVLLIFLKNLTKSSKLRIPNFTVGLGFGVIFIVNFVGSFNINSAIDDKAFLFLTSFMLFDANAVSLYLTSFPNYCLNTVGVINSHECWWQSYYRGSTYFSYPILSLLELILRNLIKSKDIQVLASLSFNYGMLFSSLIAIILLAHAGKKLRLIHLLIYWVCILYLIPFVLNNQYTGDISGIFGQHSFFTPVPRGLAILLGVFALYTLSIGFYYISLLIAVSAATFHFQFIALVPIILIIYHFNFIKLKLLIWFNSFLIFLYLFLYLNYGIFSQGPIIILIIFILCKWIINAENYSNFSINCICWLLFFSLIFFLSKAILEIISSSYLSSFTPINGGPLKFWYGRFVIETYNRFLVLILSSVIIIAVNLIYNQFYFNNWRSKIILICMILFLITQQHFFSNARAAVVNLSNFSNQFINLSGSDSKEMAGIYLQIANILYEKNFEK